MEGTAALVKTIIFGEGFAVIDPSYIGPVNTFSQAEEISILSKHSIRIRVVPLSPCPSSETVNKPRGKNGRVNSRDYFPLAVLLFLDMSFISVKIVRNLFVCNMRLKQLNLQQSIQLKCHYLGISKIKTNKI